ncbi:P-loop NTPase fold protein [Kribbella sp. NPDC056861]|uniref:P-loop NTPase fold protein n=1 Tax=Kribbella sp. NPDC056861 TaxID=3154857 RepID=UPI00342828C2
MFERFTEGARRVVVLAQDAARTLHHSYVGTEHALIALVQVEGLAVDALRALETSPEAVRAEVLATINAAGGQAPDEIVGHIPFTPAVKKALELALRESLQLGHDYIGVEHILLGLIREEHGVAAQVLTKLGLDYARVQGQIQQELARQPASPNPGQVPKLAEFGNDLTAAGVASRLGPAIGREAEVAELVKVLSRRKQNCSILVAEPGIDKATVVDGLAQAITKAEIPETLRDKVLYAVDAQYVLPGLSTNAEAAERFAAALTEAAQREDIVLFVNSLHLFFRPDSSKAGIDTAALIRPALTDPRILVIGAMTPDEYDRYLRNDSSLDRFSDPITLAEPSVPAAIEILKGLRDRYEAHHRVYITDEAIVAAAELAHRYRRDRFLPDSAVHLLDEGGARLAVQRVARPDHLLALDAQLVAARDAKEAAINEQDFELAASRRDDEKALLAEIQHATLTWQSDELQPTAQIDVDLLVTIVAEAEGTSSARILASLAKSPPALQSPPHPAQVLLPTYVLLDDQPVGKAGTDLLGSGAVAAGIASIIDLSRAASPFVLAIDGGWGVGKSTLLRQIDDLLPGKPNTLRVHFNAWTAQDDNALEGLIKSVLIELDSNLLRRWVRKLSKRRHLLGIAGTAFGIIARFFGVSRLVDELMKRLTVDAQGRNELRDVIHGMLSDWSTKDGKRRTDRNLVVFIDDLDRCSDDVVVKVCEAVKLYLDAPGLIFIIGCDMSVLARGVSSSARGGAGEGRTYLEKIVQVSYRVPAPDRQLIRDLIRGYALASGTSTLIDETVIEILAERSGRNPRRIKRIINSFVLEHHLNPGWTRPPLGSAHLITAILLHHLYPSFYEWLAAEDSGADPIGEFLDYADVRTRASDPPPSNDAWWSIVGRTFRAHGMPAPERIGGDQLLAELAELEKRLPSDFPGFAASRAFVALLKGVGDRSTRLALRDQLVSKPLGTENLAVELPGDASPQ